MTTTENYSSYWLDDSPNKVGDTDATERILRLATIRRAITNFVNILTNDPSIVVQYSSGRESYTDGSTVVLSAEESSEKFDSLVGLALHEGSHCLLTDFNFLKIVNRADVCWHSLHPQLRTALVEAKRLFPRRSAIELTAEIQSYLKLLMNIIEDRRIDSYVYNSAPGYKPYYDAMYNTYFSSPDLIKNMQRNPEWRVPTINNYINWLIMIFSSEFDATALPGLPQMAKIIDLKNIRRFDTSPRVLEYKDWEKTLYPLSDTESFRNELTGFGDSFKAASGVEYPTYASLPMIWRTANELLILILRYVQLHSSTDNPPSYPVHPLAGEWPLESTLPNLDLPRGSYMATKGTKFIDKMKTALAGTTKKKKLKKGEKEQVDSMENSGARLEETGDAIMGRIPCMVTRKLNKAIMRANWFPFSSHRYQWGASPDAAIGTPSQQAVTDGIRMGQILAHRLQIRNDPTITHFSRQSRGKIDRRMLSQLGMDIERVFKRTTIDVYHPVMLHISLDASGSMYGDKWRRALAVAVALAYVSEKIKTLDVVITIRGNIKSGIPIVSIIYDSRQDSFRKVRSLFPLLVTSGSTPEGLCYATILSLITECVATHTVYFINFSDGEPGCDYVMNGRGVSYCGDRAVKQTRGVVQKMRESGIRLMSYFITERRAVIGASVSNWHASAANKMFLGMYGDDAQFINVENISNVVRTLNNLLIIKE